MWFGCDALSEFKGLPRAVLATPMNADCGSERLTVCFACDSLSQFKGSPRALLATPLGAAI